MTLFHHLGIVASSGGVAGAPGMVLLTPTSIAHSGTSASIGANGQVTFTAVTSLSLNGVFTADFDNYFISFRMVASGNTDMLLRWRAAGTDNSTSNSYVEQYLSADGAGVSTFRNTNNRLRFSAAYTTQRDGFNLDVYGPFLAQPTACRSVTALGASGGYIFDIAGTHNQSTSYDGITVYPAANNITGAVAVYGIRS